MQEAQVVETGKRMNEEREHGDQPCDGKRRRCTAQGGYARVFALKMTEAGIRPQVLDAETWGEELRSYR